MQDQLLVLVAGRGNWVSHDDRGRKSRSRNAMSVGLGLQGAQMLCKHGKSSWLRGVLLASSLATDRRWSTSHGPSAGTTLHVR